MSKSEKKGYSLRFFWGIIKPASSRWVLPGVEEPDLSPDDVRVLKELYGHDVLDFPHQDALENEEEQCS